MSDHDSRFTSQFWTRILVSSQQTMLQQTGNQNTQTKQLNMFYAAPLRVYQNEEEDARWCRFFENQPHYLHVIVLVRGIDGASIDPGIWVFLRMLYPNLKTTIVLSSAETFVRHRAPAGLSVFHRMVPYENRLYTVFFAIFNCWLCWQHMLLAKLEMETRMAVLYRKALLMANQSSNLVAIAPPTNNSRYLIP